MAPGAGPGLAHLRLSIVTERRVRGLWAEPWARRLSSVEAQGRCLRRHPSMRKLNLSRRDFLRMAAFGAAGTIVAACGGGTPAETPTSAPAAAAPTAAAAAAAPTAAAAEAATAAPAEAPTAAAAEAPTAPAAEAPTAAAAPTAEPQP